MDVAIMVEGQDGLNWERWRKLADAAENLGFAGLYRSDHFTNGSGPHKDALELWTSLTWLAANTERIEFAPLVSPVSFRNPVTTAWTAAAIDDLSGGRMYLGMGAGWQEREHNSYGFDLLEVEPRFQRYEEGIQVALTLLQNDEPSDFSGEFYSLNDALLLPRPQRTGGPPLIVGGNGPKRTLPLAAKYATVWNAVFATPETFVELCRTLDAELEAVDRRPGDVSRTLMHRVTIGRDQEELDQKLEGMEVESLIERGALIGTPDQIVDGMKAFEQVGVERVMAQMADLDDIDGLEVLAEKVLPKVS